MRAALLACHVHVMKYLRIPSPQTRFAFRQLDANAERTAEETRLFGIGSHHERKVLEFVYLFPAGFPHFQKTHAMAAALVFLATKGE